MSMYIPKIVLLGNIYPMLKFCLQRQPTLALLMQKAQHASNISPVLQASWTSLPSKLSVEVYQVYHKMPGLHVCALHFAFEDQSARHSTSGGPHSHHPLLRAGCFGLACPRSKKPRNLFFLLPLVLYLRSGYLYWIDLYERPRLGSLLFSDTESNTFRRQQYHRDGQAGPWTAFSLRPEDDLQEG